MGRSLIKHFRIPEKYDIWIIALLGLLFFIPGIGQVHLFDWDEINFAECAREMIESSNYLQVQINYQPFWEKPPLFFWLQVLSMKIFGINEFAARFPNTIAGIVSLVCLYLIGKKWKNRQFAWLWVLAYFGSLLPHLYFRSGIIDPWFNLFIFLSIYAFANIRMRKWAFWGGTFLGLAVLTKGPVAGLIIGFCVLIFWILNRFKKMPSWQNSTLFTASCIILIAGWFGLEWIKNGPWFTKTFIEYQVRLLSTEDAGHGGFPGYHFIVLLLGCFPASTLGFRAWWKKQKEEEKDSLQFDRWMRVLFWVVLILFSLVQSKIVHYSSLCYFPLTFFAARSIYSWIHTGVRIPKLERTLTLLIGLIWIIVTLSLPILGNNPSILESLLQNDAFALANLEAAVSWPWVCLAPGVILIALLVLFYFQTKKALVFSTISTFFIGLAIFLFTTLWAFLGRIESYSQRAIIEFYESHQEEEAYYHPLGFKSYAHLWYTKMPATLRAESKDQNWLLNGNIDRDVYFISKITKEKRLQENPELEKVWGQNGFVVYRRSK